MVEYSAVLDDFGYYRTNEINYAIGKAFLVHTKEVYFKDAVYSEKTHIAKEKLSLHALVVNQRILDLDLDYFVKFGLLLEKCSGSNRHYRGVLTPIFATNSS